MPQIASAELVEGAAAGAGRGRPEREACGMWVSGCWRSQRTRAELNGGRQGGRSARGRGDAAPSGRGSVGPVDRERGEFELAVVSFLGREAGDIHSHQLGGRLDEVLAHLVAPAFFEPRVSA